MATKLIAHREERRLLGISFANDLPAGATITGVDDFVVLNAAGDDVTAEIRGGSPTGFVVASPLVSFWKEIAATGEQAAGEYRVKMRAAVDNLEKPIPLGEGYRLVRLEIVGD